MNEYIYCGFWRRVTATVLNKIIMIALGIIVIMLIASISFLLPESNTLRGIVWLLCITLPFLLIPICESSSLQAAPGWYVLRMKIINKDGTQIGFIKSLFRFIILVLINSTFFFAIISIACMMYSREKTFLHDMIFGTRMIMR